MGLSLAVVTGCQRGNSETEATRGSLQMERAIADARVQAAQQAQAEDRDQAHRIGPMPRHLYSENEEDEEEERGAASPGMDGEHGEEEEREEADHHDEEMREGDKDAIKDNGENAKPDNPWEAFRWKRLRWLDEDGEIKPGVFLKALDQRAQNVRASKVLAQRGGGGGAQLPMATMWDERGPFNVAGRSRSLLIDPRDPSRMWIGTVGGGIWYSEDRGVTWSPENDFFPTLAIGCMAMDPANPDVMYAGTGEGFFNGDAIGPAGIYRTTDGGATWAVMPATAGFDNVCRIAIAPDNSHLILAGTRYYGIQRSTDGGNTWTNPVWAQGCFDVDFDPGNGMKAIAAMIDYDWDAGDWYHHAMYTTDGGATWTNAAGLDDVAGFGSRIELAYAPSNPNIVYASCGAEGGRIWRSTDGGHSYAVQSPPDMGTGNWYANPLWVDPTNPQHILTGAVKVLASTDGGVTLTNIGQGYIMTDQPHPDIHLFVEDPGFNNSSNRRVYLLSDGGICATDNIDTANTNGGWYRRDQDLRSTQYYGAVGDGPTGIIIGGTQDNGTHRLSNDSNDAVLTFGGDGGFCAIDGQNPNICYGEYIDLQIFRSTNGGYSGSYIYSGIEDAGTAANFIAPFVLDQLNTQNMFAGGRSLWRAQNVRGSHPTWQRVFGPADDNVSAIAIAPTDSNVVYFGLNNGEVWRSSNAADPTPEWLPVDDNAGHNPLPDRYITRIVIDNDDPNRVYVSLGGFSPDNLWRSDNGGDSFIDITGNQPTGLPDAPVYGVAIHPANPNWLWAGTQLGVFASRDDGITWTTNQEGPANVVTDEINFMNHSETLLAATHGRGIYTANVTAHTMALDVSDLHAGRQATMTVTGAEPNQKVYFLYSTQGEGRTFVNPLNIVVDLAQPQLLDSVRVNSNGNARLIFQLPGNTRGRFVWIQAAQVEHLSQTVAKVVE